MVTHHHPALAATHHGQRHLQLAHLARAGVGHAAIDADFGGWVEPQAQAIAHLLQAMLQVRVKAIGVKATEQGLAGEIAARGVQVGEFFAPAKRAPSRGEAVDKTKALGSADHPAVCAGEHRRIQHHHAPVQVRAAHGRVQMQHATQGMAHAPYRFWLLLQMVDQLVHQVLPVIIHREPGVVTVLRQMGHRIFRGQGGKQLAVSGRREAIGVGKKHVLRHTGSINKNRGGLSPCPAPTAMTVTARNDDTHATPIAPAVVHPAAPRPWSGARHNWPCPRRCSSGCPTPGWCARYEWPWPPPSPARCAHRAGGWR